MGLFSGFKKEASKENQTAQNNKTPIPQAAPTSIKKETQPLFKIEQPTIPNLPEAKDPKTIDIRYPLIPPYTFARIRWDQKETELVYEIEEPNITDKEKQILDTLEEGIKELINLSFISVKDKETVLLYLEKNIRVLLTELSIELTTDSYLKIMYYIYRDFVGLNELEPLMNDYFIEDIECNGVNSPIYVVHRKYRNIRTNLIYKDIHKLASFVEKLAQKCGRYVSYAEPLLDGSLPDGSIDYDEPVIYRENGIVKLKKIGDVIDNYYKDNESNKSVNINNIEVAAFDKDYKISWRKANYAYRHKINGDLYQLDLEFGKKIKLTGCHSIFTLRNTGVISERTENLNVGDYVIIPSIIPENNIMKEINLCKELINSIYKDKLIIRDVPNYIYIKNKKELYDYYNGHYKHANQAYYEHKNKKIIPLCLYYILDEKELRNCFIGTTSSHKVPTFLEINKELMWFLGLYISEGWLYDRGSHGVYFSLNKNELNLIEEISRCAKNSFNLGIYVEPEKDNGVKVKVDGLILWIIMKDVLRVSKGAKTKVVPELIFNVSKELQKAFIKSWHAGDYSTTTSKFLANDISYLALFNQDITSFYKSKPKVTKIKGREIINNGAYYSNFYTRDVENPYPSMIPIELFNPLNKTHLRFRNKRINRNRLIKILNEIRYKRFENLNLINRKSFLEWNKRGLLDSNCNLTKEGKKLTEELNIVKKLINSDFCFAKVKKISRVKSTSEYVYDFSVENDENFVAGFGGVCCHNSRINATYTTDVSSKGPTFTARKFTKEPWSPIQLMIKGTCTAEIYAYLWMALEYENSLMVIGGTGTGKTSYINSIAFFIPPQARVVSIEDTRELQLEHENWLPSVARAGVGLTNLVGQRYGEVSLFDLLRASFRQRPDYIIVGEVRGKEAFVLFQAFASGHPGMATMHAEDVNTLIKRLETEPINLSGSLIETLSAVVVMTQSKIKGKEVRKVSSIDEIVEVKEGIGGEVTNNVFRWDPKTDTFVFNSNSKLFEKIAIHYGFTKEQVLNEFKIRAKLLRELYKRGIIGFKQVQAVVHEYYKSPEIILKRYNIV
ncbi:Flp pilus assembly complex ATPase component TadA [Candidatus Woesearchaeota archaeon]|nr:Flp pilus assembly complex ATPase component TadA [Candidatus Woesearchaeota archaeon]